MFELFNVFFFKEGEKGEGAEGERKGGGAEGKRILGGLHVQHGAQHGLQLMTLRS